MDISLEKDQSFIDHNRKICNFDFEAAMNLFRKADCDRCVDNRMSSFRGYLYKLRRSANFLAAQWGKRYFTIEGKYLRWYRTMNDIESSGMINLRFIQKIIRAECSGLKNANEFSACTFVIFCNDRNIVLRCSNVQEMYNWMKALHFHSNVVRGGSRISVVSETNDSKNGVLAITNSSSSQDTLKKKHSKDTALMKRLDSHLKTLDEMEFRIDTLQLTSKTNDEVSYSLTTGCLLSQSENQYTTRTIESILSPAPFCEYLTTATTISAYKNDIAESEEDSYGLVECIKSETVAVRDEFDWDWRTLSSFQLKVAKDTTRSSHEAPPTNSIPSTYNEPRSYSSPLSQITSKKMGLTKQYQDAETDDNALSIFSRELVAVAEEEEHKDSIASPATNSPYMNRNKHDKAPYLSSPTPHSNVLRKAVNFADNQKKVAWPVQTMNFENIYEDKILRCTSSIDSYPVGELVQKKLRNRPGQPVQPSSTPPKQLMSATKYIESFAPRQCKEGY